MTVFDRHYDKYTVLKKDAENKDNSPITRIQSYFYSAFHLIEALAATQGVHIQKHQKVRTVLGKNPNIFGEKTDAIWKKFDEIGHHIRPAQIYGGKIDGEQVEKTEILFRDIEKICNDLIGKNDKRRV